MSRENFEDADSFRMDTWTLKIKPESQMQRLGIEFLLDEDHLKGLKFEKIRSL